MYGKHLITYKKDLQRIFSFLALAVCLLNGYNSAAQPNTTIDIQKPAKYDSRTLASERSGEKKFTIPRRIYNNTVSRFNYYFNANAKLNEIIDKAKAYKPDDYTQLLPFYKFSLDITKKDHLDSVIYKCTAGILLHDLRSDWVDKLYLLMGKAYLLRKDFDSAAVVFQYINYAFAPKDDGYDIPIGSNASNTNGVFTIATKESKKLWKRITSNPPSRNESFISQAWNDIEQEKYVEAASLLEILRTDPNFPPRLQNALHEMTAYVLYKQQSWEPGAKELVKSLVKPDDKSNTARASYLAAQMYQLAKKDGQAITWFENAIKHTADPLMEVYARLNIVSLSSANQENALQKNLDELLKMAKRDKYEANRDIIYYAAAQLELKRNNYTAAQALLLKSIQYNINNPLQRQQSFLLLGDLNYERKNYALSYAYYDSTQISFLSPLEQQRVNARKPALQIISQNQQTIVKQDSLQMIAALTLDERNAKVKKVLKQLRKEKGLKDLASNDPLGGFVPGGGGSALFPLTGNGGNAEFYFLNANLRAKGFNDFKTRWGTRPNVDNWRRQSMVDRTLNISTPLKEQKNGTGINPDDKDLSFDALYKNIPLTDLQKDSSNAAILRALLGNALTFQNQLEDYPSAIAMYEEILRRFPESAAIEESLFNLSYCYRKTNDYEKADSLAAILKKSFAGGKYADQYIKGTAPKKADPVKAQYEQIYSLFIEGRFDEAKEAKLKADKQYGKTYWTPQLLFIESIYYIKQNQDSIAINRLQNITGLFAKTALAEKAATMIDVLKRRKEIESYLHNLNVDRKDDNLLRGIDLDSTNPVTGLKVRKKYMPFTPPAELAPTSKTLTIIADKNTVGTGFNPVAKKDSVALPKSGLKVLELDNLVKQPVADKNSFSFNASDTQYVVVILEKVDPIFVNEGRNAFNRFNQERFPNQKIEMIIKKIDDQHQFLLFGPFINAAEALSYIDKTRPVTGSRIIPWLTPDKYGFSMISNHNMEVLLKTNNLEGYKAFIHGVFPDKF